MNQAPDKTQIDEAERAAPPGDGDGVSDGGKGTTGEQKSFGRFGGLSSKLLLMTIVFVMVSEVFVFVPSVAKFRNDWLTDRLTRARTILILLNDPKQEAQEALQGDSALAMQVEDALRNIDVVTLAHKRGGRKQLVAMLEQSSGVAARFDVNETGVLQSIRDAFGTLLAQEPRTILVTGKPPGSNEVIELVALEEPLRNAMLIYTRNVLILSLIISCLTAAMVYFTLTLFFVRPVRRMAENMVAFSEYPEATDSIIKPTGRSDEIGVAEERLAAMQADLQGTLSSQKRLASLGLAMSKVNHDLRNILASVQLFSDRLATVSDPDVQRFAPKLMRGIDHAISYCQATLVYGSASNEPPEKRVVRLAAKVDEIAGLLNLEENREIEWVNSVPPDTEVEVDPEQIFRVLMNLARNAIKAMESLEGDGIVRRLEISSDRLPDRTRIYVIDTGPGVPEKAKTHLFEAFRGSVSHGGVGLGLAIASEFVRGHGGQIRLADDGRTGATFEVDIPHPGTTLT